MEGKLLNVNTVEYPQSKFPIGLPRSVNNANFGVILLYFPLDSRKICKETLECLLSHCRPNLMQFMLCSCKKLLQYLPFIWLIKYPKEIPSWSLENYWDLRLESALQCCQLLSLKMLKNCIIIWFLIHSFFLYVINFRQQLKSDVFMFN